MAGELNGGERREVEIVSLSHDGRGIARIDGKVVFVDGALPGERVILALTKRRRHLDEARLVEVLAPSPERVTPGCTHFGVCGGCSLQHLSAAGQLAAKQGQLLEDLERIGRVRPQRILAPVEGPSWAYRRRARLGVKYVHKMGRVLAGFREREKPYLADVRRCAVLAPGLEGLPEELAALVGTLSIRDRVPQVEVAAGDEAAALVFRVMQPPSADDLERLADFGTRRGLQIFLQTGGPATIAPLGAAAAPLTYSIDGFDVRIGFGPADFVQVNRSINAAMVAAAAAALDPEPGDAVLDLFCGLGNFTLPLARRAGTILGVEGDAGLVEKARANAAANGIDNAAFHAANLFEPAGFGAWADRRFDLVLLDPPRAGAEEAVRRMAHWSPRRVVYISCHSGSLARDAGVLVASQGYELAAAGVMDMFPHTTHVESMAVFRRIR